MTADANILGGAGGGAAAAALPGATVTVERADAPMLSRPAKSQARQSWESFREHRAAFIGLCVLAMMVVVCAVGPFFLADPTEIDYSVLSATPPSANHLLGTDSLGRDVLARVVSAGRTSLMIGLVVALTAAAIGSLVGVMAGYFGGKVDTLLMWIVNVLMTIPSLPLLIVLAVVVANEDSKVGGFIQLIPEAMRIAVVLVVLGWMGISRVVRSQVITLKNQEFVEAAHALGASHSRIMFMHILPNCVGVIAVFTTLTVSTAILAESALSFLGFGVQPPTATWGNMLAEGSGLISIIEYWWTVWFPALAIFATVLSVNFIGDGVRDALDPKTQKR